MNTFKNKRTQAWNLLDTNLAALAKAKKSMLFSVRRCTPILQKTQAMQDIELESCEALTARFARTLDIFTQKILPNIFLLLEENPLTFLDKAHLAEKFGIVKNADKLIEMRSLRNAISHEYKDADLAEIFKAACDHVAKLCDMIDAAERYAKQLKKNSEAI